MWLSVAGITTCSPASCIGTNVIGCGYIGAVGASITIVIIITVAGIVAVIGISIISMAAVPLVSGCYPGHFRTGRNVSVGIIIVPIVVPITVVVVARIRIV